MTVAGIILAAGLSRRFGTANKLLAPFRGKPLVRWTAEAASASRLSPVVVVLGHDAARVRAVLDDLPGLVFVDSPDHRQGQSRSVRAGLAAVAEAPAAMFLMGDQPLLDAATIDRLIDAFEASDKPIVHPLCGGALRTPVVFAARMFPEIARVSGDAGARSVVAAHPDLVAAVPFASETVFRDVDDPGDLAALEAAP